MAAQLENRGPFNVRLRPAERRLLEDAAASQSERPATWARQELVAAARRTLAAAREGES